MKNYLYKLKKTNRKFWKLLIERNSRQVQEDETESYSVNAYHLCFLEKEKQTNKQSVCDLLGKWPPNKPLDSRDYTSESHLSPAEQQRCC